MHVSTQFNSSEEIYLVSMEDGSVVGIDSFGEEVLSDIDWGNKDILEIQQSQNYQYVLTNSGIYRSDQP